jgi:hypothetical protein
MFQVSGYCYFYLHIGLSDRVGFSDLISLSFFDEHYTVPLLNT